MMEWLEDKVMLLRLRTLRYVFIRKEQESVVFVKEKFLLYKIQKKRRYFQIFDHKLAEEGSVK